MWHSGDVQDQVAHLSLSENQNLTQGETNPSFPETNQNTLVTFSDLVILKFCCVWSVPGLGTA